MIFIWGKKLVYRELGYVADFCSICRVPRQFSVRRVGLAGHVYYITSGEGELLGHERTCQECRIAFKAEPATYAAFSKERRPLAELMAKTYPNFAVALKERLELEDKLRTTPAFLTPQERTGLIELPFFLLSPKVEERLANFRLDVRVSLTIVAAIFLAPLSIALAEAVLPVGTPPQYAPLTIIGLAIAIIWWQAAGSGGRWVRREIVPVLAKTLRPLKPTEGELQAVLAELKKYKHKLGGKLKVGDLIAQIQGAA